MTQLMNFSANVLAQFDNNLDNINDFISVMKDASERRYTKYSKEDSDKIISTQFDRILGINFKEASRMKRRQAWRDHGRELASLIENIVVDRMESGWNTGNTLFMQYVKDVNIGAGDKNEFFVEDNSLLQVSKFAGDHHDVVRQAVKPGKSFSIDTSAYVIKVYTDYVLFANSKIDFAELIDRMYKSIEQNRYAALNTAFMSADKALPSDMILETPISDLTKDDIFDHIEAVKTATGKDCILVGTPQAIRKLQKTINYNMFSDSMKNEVNQNGMLGNWEGYTCLVLDRVNIPGTRESVFTEEDRKKIFVVPVDGEPFIYRVNEGDVIYNESGMDGSKKDMTVAAELTYYEGIGVVISELFGLIKIKDQ